MRARRTVLRTWEFYVKDQFIFEQTDVPIPGWETKGLDFEVIEEVNRNQVEENILKKLKKKAIDKDKQISECFEEALVLWLEK